MTEPMIEEPRGIVGVYVDPDGCIIASVSDFKHDCYGGCTLQESQKVRTRRALAVAIVRAYCSSVVVSALDGYDCEQIASKLNGKMSFIAVGHERVES